MMHLSGLSKAQRLILGVVVLLLVDFIRVASSEILKYFFHDVSYQKPFFMTYTKTAMFVLYLFGFILWRPWRDLCRKENMGGSDGRIENWLSSLKISKLIHIEDGESQDSDSEFLTEPIYVPLKADKRNQNGTESDDSTSLSFDTSRTVRFSNLSEVRQLSEKYAEDATIARLSYTASLRAEEIRLRVLNKLTLKQVIKLSLIFCILWFFSHLAFQEALLDTEEGIINALSSTSGIFTLILSAMYPISVIDKLTLTKAVTVLISIGGVVLVCFADIRMPADVPIGALWSLLGAMLYALYIVVLRRKVDHEDRIDLPMFLGFVGLFSSLLLWPGFLILHYTKAEEFQWPSKHEWFSIIVHGVVGTVLSELLWLWGCFLTSTLTATLSLSLLIPLTMLSDKIMQHPQPQSQVVVYNWMLYVGTIPVFLSFFALAFLTHFDTWDPLLLALKKCFSFVYRRKLMSRFREMDREQTESLINLSSDR